MSMKTKHDARSRRQRAAAPPTMPPRQEGDATARTDDVEQDADFLTTVSKRLVVATLIMLGMTVALFLIPLFLQNRFPLSWFCFGVGIIGGFVSIQQRLKLLSPEELALLVRSWVHIFVIPLFGGIFALVLYLLVLAGILEGALFPTFAIGAFPEAPATSDLRQFFLQTYPVSGQDFAKLAFWSFAAGFSERWIPDLIEKKTPMKQSTGQ